ncbi:MAG: cytochrome c [Planctomycetaceae bacterium]
MAPLLQVFPDDTECRADHNQMWLALSTLLIFCAGCGGSPDAAHNPAATDSISSAAVPSESSANPATTSTTDADGSSGRSAAASVRHGRGEVWVDEKGQKWFGEIPMDAFFDQPYTVASNATPIGGDAAPTAVVSGTGSIDVPDPGITETPAAPSGTETTPPPSATGDSWGDLISAVEIDDEVKAIRNFLNENLQSVSNYNSAMLMIPPKAATLGALAGVAMEHPNAVSWKDDGKYIRDLAKQMNSDTLRSGPKDQKRILQLYEAMSDTLNRSRPADLPEPPESDGFAEVSEMRLLMHRMEEAEKRMKTEAGTDSALTSRKDMVAHEAALMATFAKIVTLPGYGYEDDPKFKGYASDVVQAALAIKEAAVSNDFAAYELSLTKVSTSCSNCHSDYKNN